MRGFDPPRRWDAAMVEGPDDTVCRSIHYQLDGARGAVLSRVKSFLSGGPPRFYVVSHAVNIVTRHTVDLSAGAAPAIARARLHFG